MTTSPAPTPESRPYTPRHAAPEPAVSTPLQTLDGATAEIEHWQEIIGDIAEQHHAHPSINVIRFESATRAMAPLDQLEARLRDVLTLLGAAPPRRLRDAAGQRPRRPRRWPPELTGVPESHLQGEHLRQLTYAQLHAFAMADHPDEVDEMAHQWYRISRAAWKRGTRVRGSLEQASDEMCDPLAQLADGYWGFAARTDHYARTFLSAARSYRTARAKLEDLGPP